jgi:hypothetical protein
VYGATTGMTGRPPTRPHTDTRGVLFNNDWRAVPQDDHLAVHPVDAEALLVDEVEGPEEVSQGRVAGEPLGKHSLCGNAADESAWTDHLHG